MWCLFIPFFDLRVGHCGQISTLAYNCLKIMVYFLAHFLRFSPNSDFFARNLF